jgi:uncharacterized protein (DUF4415 family)
VKGLFPFYPAHCPKVRLSRDRRERFAEPSELADGSRADHDAFRMQLKRFRRTPKVLVAARLDRDVYEWLQRYGKGYSTRINSILRAVMSRSETM